jgi:glutamate-1-semialdehyde 2,1-aminomutase
VSRTWAKSRALRERALQSLAGGVSSPVRATAPVPLYYTGGKGARLFDEDGNEYIDYQLAWGPNILGYAHPRMVEAMRARAEQPYSFGAQHALEISVAEQIQSMVPCAERVAFTSSGSETVQLAHRLARAHTGRSLILKFEGHYHGWMDTALHSHHATLAEMGPADTPLVVAGSAGQTANAADNILVAPWNRPRILERILDRNAGKVAGIIMEAVLCNSGCIMPQPGYLERVQELARMHRALLIFDEVITGFRLAPGGAQSHFGVIPDLATFGKAIGGGVPLSAVAGRKDIMEQMFSGGVVFGGTFNGNPLSLTGADVCLSELARDGGAALIHANCMGERIRGGLRELAHQHGIPLQVTGFGAAFCLHFNPNQDIVDYRDTLADDSARLSRFLYRALEEGIVMVPDGRMYVSAAHTERDVEETLAAFTRVFASL